MSYIPQYTINEKIRSNLQEIERLKDQIRGSRILPEVEASVRLRASVEYFLRSINMIVKAYLSLIHITHLIAKPIMRFCSS